jgi:hypothetical protein
MYEVTSHLPALFNESHLGDSAESYHFHQRLPPDGTAEIMIG